MAQSYHLTSLYVGDLHPDVNEAMLHERFSSTGAIVSVRVCRDKMTRRSLGYAYVYFTNHQDAECALDTLNFEPINGHPCRIMWSQKDPGLRKSGFGNIFIKNLDKAIDNKALFDTFSAFGNILSCKVATDETGESRGFGYVHFEKQEDAEKSIDKVNGMSLNEKIVFVGRFISKKERQATGQGELKRKFEPVKQQKIQARKGENLFVKNLEDEITDEMLRTNFTPYGVITSCKVMRDETNHSKGFGFVCFATPEEATKAVTELNGKIIITKPLYVAIAQRKEERRALLTQQFVNRQMTHISRQNPQHLASGMMPAAATLMPYGPNFSANIPRAYNPALRLPAPGSLRGGTNVAAGVPAAGAYGQSLQQMSGAKMGEMRGTNLTPYGINYNLRNNREPVKTRSRTNSSSSSERLSNYLSSVKIRSAPSSPTREFSQNFTFEQQTKDLHPITPNSSFQASNVEEKARNKSGKKTLPIELVSPQKSECVEDIQDFISRFEAKSEDSIFSRLKIVLYKDPERNKRQNKVENKHQTQMHPETVQIEYDACTSRKSVEDKIYDTARREHPNEANLIVGLIQEKRNKEQLQLIASSDVLLNHEVEKAHSKIRMLETPMCQNYL